ncbi:MAG: hypothetical protein ACIAXF_07970 [Phycisphaerales bacterium JB063]
MRLLPVNLRRFVFFALCVLYALPAPAQDDPRAYDAAVYLLSQTTQPYRDGRHNDLLLSLRHLQDPAMSPLFEALINSAHPPQRVHGHLGLAEISPNGHLDLAAVAEIESPSEIVELLGAAIDSGVLAQRDLVQVLAWEGLDATSRQALAVHVVAAGGAVDDTLLLESLIRNAEGVTTPQVLRHGLAALLLMQRGDASARGELDKLNTIGPDATRDAVRAQLLEVALRHDFEAIGPWALELAQDDRVDLRLRLVALRAALRFLPDSSREPALAQWANFFAGTDDAAQRIRLALIALEASPYARPDLYSPLFDEADALFQRIAVTGRAIASRDPNAEQAIIELVEHGHPMAVLWAARYAQDHAGESRRAILLAILNAFEAGPERSRGRRAASAIDAVQALAELEPQAATEVLPGILEQSPPRPRGELAVEHVILLGLVRANGADLAALARAIPEPNDSDAADLALLLRARWDAPLSAAQWQCVSQIVAGQTSLDDSLRIQMAWLYLKHLGRAGDALRDVAAQAR